MKANLKAVLPSSSTWSATPHTRPAYHAAPRLRSLGFSWVTFLHQVQWSVSYGSLFGGLLKSFVFALLVAAIGCLRGLETKTGARSVGESTTSAVVSGIILIVIADGIFSIIYYYLGV